MSALHTSLPQRPGTTPAVKRLPDTDVIRPSGRAPSDPPPPIVVCDVCGAVEDRPDPPGWFLATPAHNPYVCGICPACLSDQFSLTDHCDTD